MTVAPAMLVNSTVISAGQVICGAGFAAVFVLVEVLSFGFASGVVVLAVAVLFKMVPSATEQSTLTWSVTLALLPDAKSGRLQVTVPAEMPHPADEETKCIVAGNVSLTVTPAAVCGPLFLTAIV